MVGSSRIPPQEAGAASGVFTMVQQVAFTLGIAVIVGMFFSQLGPAPDARRYTAALSVALGCNAVLMLLTCGLAFALPRGAGDGRAAYPAGVTQRGHGSFATLLP